VNISFRIKVYPWGPSSPLGANFAPVDKLILYKTGLSNILCKYIFTYVSMCTYMYADTTCKDQPVTE
jgi:hypothetical protein